ncbi:hypothetical protein E8D34_01630 [Nocardioides sp. GY 10113]|uniref:hypothetical protein n=1 Tax=Nocardioides sp. GY 10113 TaxID=2569761 RepID=UPI0010A85BEB|nr:hypothetical protein [Nocardioides sp. GY 10113]TIC89218.1 hypothetical protein E8D34_01630 [Nocardioides sp. GY 10113]
MNDLALPDGSILFHIGPHKTGTTAIQRALWDSRATLTGLGVEYPGSSTHEMAPATAVATDRVDPGRDLAVHRAEWLRMVAELHDRRPRVGVISSEFYSEAGDERTGWLLDRLGPGAHVVITLRPLARIIGSQWQQYVQNKLAAPYERWLEVTLGDLDGPQLTPTFWGRHRHDLLVRRWVAAAGADRVTVVVVDDRDPGVLLGGFERLLDVPPGTLVPSGDRANRSLTLEEAELMRAFNGLRRREAWDDVDYDRFVRFGAARAVQARPPTAGDHKLRTPEWAVRRALEIGAGFAREIEASGARVVGSLDLLGDPALAPETGENEQVEGVDPAVLGALVAGLVNGMTGVRGVQSPRPGAGVAEQRVWSRHRAVVLASAASSPAPAAEGPAWRRRARRLARRVRDRLPGAAPRHPSG